ncbi:amidohydrolase family protein [Conexibacter woesei]|nr:amidohydrolase family protein [Conexibacter woesei]
MDVCATSMGPEGWKGMLGGLHAEAPAFLHALGGAYALAAGLAPAELRAQLRSDPSAAIERLARALGTDVDADAEELRAGGVRRAVVHGSTFPLPGGGTVNDHVAARAARHPDLIDGWAGVDLRDAAAAVAEIDRCAALGMRGVTVIPFLAAVDAESAACRAVYEHAAARGLPVWLHCGFHPVGGRAMTTPEQLDRIAAAHPRLALVAGHGGWPWVGELVAVLMRHPNVYLDTSAHDPARMAAPGSGWEPLLHGLAGPLRRQVVFGSAALVHGRGWRDFAGGVPALGLPDALAAAWLYGNAARLLDLKGND